MSKVVVRSGTVKGFFERARAAARRADRGGEFPRTITLSFEDPQQMFSVLSASRRQLVRAVMAKPMTVAELTRALRRDRTAVATDWRLQHQRGRWLIPAPMRSRGASGRWDAGHPQQSLRQLGAEVGGFGGDPLDGVASDASVACNHCFQTQPST